jgi:hypothetical protein
MIINLSAWYKIDTMRLRPTFDDRGIRFSRPSASLDASETMLEQQIK